MDRNLVFSFTLFGKTFSVYWYGVMIAIGILACFTILFLYCKYKKVSEKFADFCFYNALAAIACGIGGAALFQAVYNYIDNPSAGFNFGSGLTFIGGLIGGVGFFLVVYFIVWRKFDDTLLKIMPIVGSCVTVAHGFGRIGCFIAGCCYGIPTGSDYGCYFDTLTKVHPTQIYEAVFLFILCAVLTFLAFKYEFQYNMGIYLIAYGIFRFINEYFRGDDRGEFFIKFLSPSQFWSIVMVLLGVAYILAIKFDLFGKARAYLDIKKHNRDISKENDSKNADSVSENEKK